MEHHALFSYAQSDTRQSRTVIYDARSVANSIIELSLEYDQSLTHLSLHKILYFIHGRHIVQHGSPLVNGHFEAWKFGPVHPLIFISFRDSKGRRIVDLAKKFDPMTGLHSALPKIEDKEDRLFVRSNAAHFLKLPASRLVDLSHADGSPWDLLTRRPSSERVYGDRITNELIEQYFHRHIVPVRDEPLCGEPIDEQPPS